MKTTKKLLKTLLMSLMLVSCLGANAMAEEGVTDSGNMNVNLDLQSTFTWQIPQGITIDQSTLKGKIFMKKILMSALPASPSIETKRFRL